MLHHAFGLLVHPRQQWQTLHDLSEDSLKRNSPYTILFALLPALAWYIGTTEFGWSIGGGATTRMTEDSALSLMAGFYFSLLISVTLIGYGIHWMSKTYGVKTDALKGFVVAGYIATPIFIAGAAGIYPQLWLNILLVLAAFGYSIYLLYTGLPIMFDMSEERGFLFASAVVAVSMVVAVGMMGGMVIFWDLVSAPEFI